MKTEEIIDRLRNPQKYNKTVFATQQNEQVAQTVRTKKHVFLKMVTTIVTFSVLIIAVAVWLITLYVKNQAEDLSSSLDPKNLQGLSSNLEFKPSKKVYVRVEEGLDRNPIVDELGTTLPVINRSNYQAMTPKDYEIIGMAPWALTENFTANIQDPDLLLYLLNRKEVGEAFVARNDVTPLLADPQLLAAFAQDTGKVAEFFESALVRQTLANPALVRKIGGSRFMSYLLTSKAVKYYRNHPQEAAKIITSSPVLNAVRQNPAVRQAVTENYYLKAISSQLLGPQARKNTAAKTKSATTTRKSKKK